MKKRSSQRFTKRLEVAFSSGGSRFTGISSDLSAGGLFIRTQHGLSPGNSIDIEIYLPEDKVGRIKGVVRRTVKTSLSLIKNGMGVEILDADPAYLDFVKTFEPDGKTENTAPQQHARHSRDEKPRAPKAEERSDKAPEFVLIACSSCKVKNKVRSDRLIFGPKCGKCGTTLNTADIS